MPKTVPNTFNYTVPNTGDVFLDLIIGNSQLGSSDVYLANKRIRRLRGSAKDIFIGKSEDLQGESLTIISNTSDVNPQTNDIIVTYNLGSNGLEQEETITAEVGDDGIIIFITLFQLNEQG